MPKSEMREQSEYAIPEETLCPCRLDKVEVKEFPSRDRQTGALNGETYNRWLWTFKVTSGPYAGLIVTKLTTPFISTHPDNVVRHYAETLTGKTWGMSEGIDTDELVGLQGILTVRHQEPRNKRDGSGKWYGIEVADLFPPDALEDSPPF